MSNKTILVVSDGNADDYSEDIDEMFGDGNRIIVKEVNPNTGDKLRGYNPELLVLTTDVSDKVRRRVLGPMMTGDTEVIRIY